VTISARASIDGGCQLNFNYNGRWKSPVDDEAALIELHHFRAEDANRAKIIECCFRLTPIVRQDDVAAHEIHAFLGSEIPDDDTSNAENAKTGKSRERFLRVTLSRVKEYCKRLRHRTAQ